MNILIIAPHPDDEVLGCGGTIAKYIKNSDNVYVCYVTRAYTPDWSEEFIANRESEIKKANKILNIKKAYFLDFPTCKLDTIPQKTLNDALAKVVSEVNPDVVYIPHGGDLHMDHKLVYEAAMVVARPYASQGIKKILCYETVSETEWGTQDFRPNVYEDIDGFMDTKLQAMQAYKSEIKPFPHPRSREVLSALAIKRGSEAGVKVAEAFMQIREIV
jgi:N-acetylglucosamine malate deacetylase 1